MLTALAPSSVVSAVRAIQDRNAGILRDLLGRWVSEAEPVTVWMRSDQGRYEEIIGLTTLGDPEGTIYVRSREGMN